MFTEEQVKQAKEFGQFIGRKAKFDQMSTAECVELVKHFQFYNKLVVQLEDHILELRKVINTGASDE